MFSTTLRLDDDPGRLLRAAAEAHAMSVNGWVAEWLRREQAAARRKLAADWAAYRKDSVAQEVAYAFEVQAEVAAEPRRRSYRARTSK
jgi:hypothetical protein